MPAAHPGQYEQQVFQSTPSVSRGRCTDATGAGFCISCFNPRPPFPEGDAVDTLAFVDDDDRFNPRPPFPEGDAS